VYITYSESDVSCLCPWVCVWEFFRWDLPIPLVAPTRPQRTCEAACEHRARVCVGCFFGRSSKRRTSSRSFAIKQSCCERYQRGNAQAKQAAIGSHAVVEQLLSRHH